MDIKLTTILNHVTVASLKGADTEYKIWLSCEIPETETKK